MNSTKKGPCYGFRLQSLDSLSITKSSDKKQTLVHYLANLVNSKYPELKGFDSELKYIDKAAQFSLENILTDVRELEKGMFLVLKSKQFCHILAKKKAEFLPARNFKFENRKKI
jgi:hypothetical protein